MSANVAAPGGGRWLLSATLERQCWGFMIGSALFAVGSAPGFVSWAGASAANLSFFVGAWFFTGAALIQFALSGAASTSNPDGSRQFRGEWLSAATQFGGTLLFNVSTAAALHADTITEDRRRVWSPDAAGSVAFLVSGVLAMVVFSHSVGFWAPRLRDWWATQLNLLGCIAFGVSAVGAYVTSAGQTVSDGVASGSTFVGAICFLMSAAMSLPRWTRT
ncbi:hypothetical protein GTV32_07185 [Gordonia sp. SID5947]|uniref:hypothetical protein n=1 Tax=Gordonia sp. SID5947 TaxID=2690315 RepID=UPI00136868D6|nr:hypothetical protein [Gordonia sp. SID5947]MYR06105.1 hypothetical protein [Gordonia sp. SID5947]